MKKKVLGLTVALMLLTALNAFALTFDDTDTFKIGKTNWTQTFLDTKPGKAAALEALTLVFTLSTGDFRAGKTIQVMFDTMTVGYITTIAGKYTYTLNVTDASYLTKPFRDGKFVVNLDNQGKNSVVSSTLSGTYSVAPEPATMLLMGAGLASLPIVRRLRKKGADKV
jgi:hypothetical protein